MGTTLTGTTPQDTYDSLIKVTDNGPLSGTSKYLSDGLGNDSVLALSTTALGIGTTSLSGKFHAQATNSGIFFDLTTAYTPIIKAAGAISDLQIESVGSGGNLILGAGGAASIMTFFTNGNSSTGERMRITSAGNVGVGTSSPTAALHIVGADENQLRLGTADTEWYQIGRDVASGLLYFYGSQSSYTGYVFTGVNGERMRITEAGNVGIGTSAPNFILETAGTTGIGVRSTGVDGVYTDILSSVYSANANEQNAIQASVSATAGNSGFRFQVSDGGGLTTQTIGYQLNKDRHVFYANGTERVRVTTDGLTFNGDTAAANALDDYEEGTWTMGVTFGGASVGVTTSNNTGTYTKIGRQVTVNGLLQLTSKGSSTGSARITGLPFTIANGNTFYSTAGLQLGNVTFTNQYSAIGAVFTTTIELYEATILGVITNLTDADFANNSDAVVSLTYFV